MEKKILEIISKEVLMEHIDIGVVVTDVKQSDNPIIYVNKHFERMTGYTKEESLGRNCRFLQGKETCQSDVIAIKSAVKCGAKLNITLKNYRKDGSMFWNRLMISPIFDSEGRIEYYLGLQHDVTNDFLTIESQESLIKDLKAQLRRTQLKAS